MCRAAAAAHAGTLGIRGRHANILIFYVVSRHKCGPALHNAGTSLAAPLLISSRSKHITAVSETLRSLCVVDQKHLRNKKTFAPFHVFMCEP